MNMETELNRVLDDRKVALKLLSDLPLCAGFVNFNEGNPIFIWHEKYIGAIGAQSPKCYNPDTDEYEDMNILYKHWDEYRQANGVFSAMDFRMKAVKRYPLDVLGPLLLRTIVARRPDGGQFYNAFSGHYYRQNNDLNRMEWWAGRVGSRGNWLDSYHSIEDGMQILIDLQDIENMLLSHDSSASFKC